MSGSKEKWKENYLRTRKKFRFVVCIVYLLLGVIFFILRANESFTQRFDLGLGANYSHQDIYLVMIIVYSVLSIKIVRSTEIASKVLLGRPFYNVESGLVIVPFGICWLKRFQKDSVELNFPAERELIQKENKALLPDGKIVTTTTGKVPPLRIVTSGTPKNPITIDPNDPVRKIDALFTRLTMEPSGQALWHIDDASQFLAVVGSVEKANSRLLETIHATITEEYGKRMPYEIITHKGEIDTALELAVSKLVGEDGAKDDTGRRWGIKVEMVIISEQGLPRRVSEALANLGKSISDMDTAANEGMGEGRRIANIGKGMKEMAEDLGVDGYAVLQTQTSERMMSKLGENQNVVLVAGSGEGNSLAHLAANIAAVAKSTPTPRTKTVPSNPPTTSTNPKQKGGTK